VTVTVSRGYKRAESDNRNRKINNNNKFRTGSVSAAGINIIVAIIVFVIFAGELCTSFYGWQGQRPIYIYIYMYRHLVGVFKTSERLKYI